MPDKPSPKAPAPARTAYLVLGMHRSGTSALANLLALAGADLPREVMPADAHNARGYFEPWRIAVFNDRRLAAAGTAWDDPFAALAPAPEDEADWREEARRLFRAQFGRRRRPLLKDPRVSVLGDLWRGVLDAPAPPGGGRVPRGAGWLPDPQVGDGLDGLHAGRRSGEPRPAPGLRRL